jgi:glycine/D-amino acid oxidase-like deaminating enzyme
MRIAVIGGGVFGTMIAVRLAEFGHSVSLLERLPALMQGTSSLANRLHFGFHYPRDEETARQCKRGFARFKQEFADAVLPGIANAYFIAREGSLTSPSAFLAFCQRMHLPYRQIEPDRFEPPVKQVARWIVTDELMYDPRILRRLLSERLLRSAVAVRTDIEVIDIRRMGKSFRLYANDKSFDVFDAVVNCCYADGTRLTARLGHSIDEFRYEYAAASIVELDLPRAVSLSILDGPFMCLLPFGSGGQYLLYHVAHGRIAQHETDFLDRRWLEPETSPFAQVNKEDWFDAQLASCCEFVPALRTCRLKSFVQGPRRVLAKSDATNARPSIVTDHEPGYLSVFSGKIDHSVWVADEVASRFGHNRETISPSFANLERLAMTGQG